MTLEELYEFKEGLHTMMVGALLYYESDPIKEKMNLTYVQILTALESE